MISKSPKKKTMNTNPKKIRSKVGGGKTRQAGGTKRHKRIGQKKPVISIGSYEAWLSRQRPKIAPSDKANEVSFIELDTRERWIKTQPIAGSATKEENKRSEVTPVRDSLETWIAERVVELQSREAEAEPAESIDEEREEKAPLSKAPTVSTEELTKELTA